MLISRGVVPHSASPVVKAEWAGQSQLPHHPKSWWEGTEVPQPPIPTAGICQGAFWGAEVTFANPFSELGSGPFFTVVFVCRGGFQRHNTHRGKIPLKSILHQHQRHTPCTGCFSTPSKASDKTKKCTNHPALLDELLSALTCRCFRKSRAICTFCRRWKRIRPFSRGCKRQAALLGQAPGAGLAAPHMHSDPPWEVPACCCDPLCPHTSCSSSLWSK